MDASTVQTDPARGLPALPLAPGAPREPTTSIRRLLALRVPVIVKLAERRMRVAEVMRFSPGTIIEFEKLAAEPLDLLVNNVMIGHGDVVKIGENFGLRISQIGRPQQMVRALGGAPGQDEPASEQGLAAPQQDVGSPEPESPPPQQDAPADAAP